MVEKSKCQNSDSSSTYFELNILLGMRKERKEVPSGGGMYQKVWDLCKNFPSACPYDQFLAGRSALIYVRLIRKCVNGTEMHTINQITFKLCKVPLKKTEQITRTLCTFCMKICKYLLK